MVVGYRSCDTVQMMPLVEKSSATLGFYGDDLDPSEITARLGAAPSFEVRKGDERASRVERIARTGRWMLSAEDRSPADLNGQINDLLDGLTDDLSIWRPLSERFDGRVYCGLFLASANEEVDISRETLAHIVDRGLYLGLDIDGHGRSD